MRGTLDTPFGPLTIDAGEHGIVACGTWISRDPPADDSEAAHAHLAAARDALAQYLAGERTRFSDLTLAPAGTAFQQRVWSALREVPFGATRTYSELAAAVGRPRSFRAVGQANARNPLGIFQPCHRILGSDGSLTGFAGGVAMKRWLLDHERRIAEQHA